MQNFIVTHPTKGGAETPDLLADAAIRFLGVEEGQYWLDPCAGSGQLVNAMRNNGVPAKNILAVDVQTELPQLQRLRVDVRLGTDFLQWAQETDRRFDRIVANPPFVSISKLDDELAIPAKNITLKSAVVLPSANYWVPFVIAGLRLLDRGGSLAYILPAAWEYADYATSVRKLCAGSFREFDVHRVSEPMFKKVNDGCVLIVGHGYDNRPRRKAHIIKHGTLNELDRSSRSHDFGSATPSRFRRQRPTLSTTEKRLGDVARIQIGAVTGDVRYFLMNEQQRIDRKLPRSAVTPILTRAAQLTRFEMGVSTWSRLLEAGKRVWLFSPSGSDLDNPAVRAYLSLAAALGGCNREATKIKERNPWYRVKTPGQFHGFVSGMSQTNHWVVLNRMPGLTISNTLYGVQFTNGIGIEGRAAWCLAMLSSITVDSRSNLTREYPQGLLKLEPKDFEDLVVPRPKKVKYALELYREAIELIISGRHVDAQNLVDDWLS